MVLPEATMLSAPVHLTLPPASLVRLPPSYHPATLTPPVSDHTLAVPFNINPTLYNDLLSINYPVTIGLLYATTVVIMGKINKSRGYKPWAFSKTSTFWLLVIAHNLLLAVYSAWTFVGMVGVMKRAMPSWGEGQGLTGVVDALCHINGPRGVGNAVTYNHTTSLWGATNHKIKLLDGSPDSSDVGRIWNEGLAFYGWLFYLSKFYEVIDTAIILAKGKKSSLLQTYHHTGAMLCMWAGIRYMSPPIWMFVLVNAGIHAMMYTYYAASALGFKTPMIIKRSLTTAQITQFLVGTPYALVHLFITYKVPVSVPYLFSHGLSTAIPAMASTASSVVSSVAASASIGSWAKKIALRAAGEEGLAENVHNAQGSAFGHDAIHNQQAEHARQETRYRFEDQYVHCTESNGQAFAILLNVMYLLPLTYLFISFFIQSYIKRTSSSAKHPTHKHAIQKSSEDAIKGLEREIRESLAQQGIFSDLEFSDVDLPEDAKNLINSINHLKKSGGKVTQQGIERVKEEAGKWTGKTKKGLNNVRQNAQPMAENAKENVKSAATNGKAHANGKKNEQVDRMLDQAGKKANGKDEMAYEASVDDAMSAKDKKAEGEMQPKGL